MNRNARILYLAKSIVAGDTVTEYMKIPMTGELKVKPGSYVTLEVPQEFTDNVYNAIYEEGMEKPEHGAHISVMTDFENDKFGPIFEDGKEFEYTISSIESCNPEGWDEMEKVWFVKCHSPQLEKLRMQYGMNPLMFTDHDFHITVALQPKDKNKQ
jgi:hypothetical protein